MDAEDALIGRVQWERTVELGSVNPWCKVDLGDYEGHMALPCVGQAAMLARELRDAVEQALPRSLALVGCAGGNGLDAIGDFGLERIVCVDVNPHYIEALRSRYANTMANLECHCCELERFRSAAPVELIFAGLILEYTRLGEALESISRLITPGGHLFALVQMPAPGVSTVTPSPYAQALLSVGEAFNYVAPSILAETASKYALRKREQRVITLESGKSFTVVKFWKDCVEVNDTSKGAASNKS